MRGMKKRGMGSEGEEAKKKIKISKKSQTLSVAIAAVIVSSIMVAFVPLASAGVTSFTISPAEGTAGAVSTYEATLNTTGFTSLNIIIPAGFEAVAPGDGDLIAEAWLLDNQSRDYYVNVTANSTDKVDVYGYASGDTVGPLTFPASYNPGDSINIRSPWGGTTHANLTLPTDTGNGILDISLPASLMLTNVSISIGEFVKNPTKADDYVFVADGVDSNIVRITAAPTPTVYRRGGGGVPRDSDDDSYSDIDEMLAGTDPYDATIYPGALVVTPTPSPTPTPTLPLVTPTPSPTPKPWIPGFEAVFAIAGLLAAVIYLVLRRKK